MEKIKIIAIIGLIVIIAATVIGVVMFNEANKQEIIIPSEYSLESNESGVETYVNNLSNGYKLEIKEDGNSKGIKNKDMYGTVMKCSVNGKKYIMTCYMPVDKSKEVVIDPRHPDITAHPGVQKVQGYSEYGSLVSNGIIECSENIPYDMQVLQDMNKTGNFNVTYFKQTFTPEFQEARDQINKADAIESLERHGYI